jgi:sentrin-specific protease 8
MADDIVLNYYNSLLRRSDIIILQDSEWLNDHLIGFWFEYLENDVFKTTTQDFCLVSPEVAHFIKLGSPDESKLFVELLNLSAKDYVFLPVNNSTSYDCPGGSHWSLLVWCNKAQQFFHFDSMDGTNFGHASKTAKNLGLKSVEKVVQVKCTQQKNGFDCGVFVCCQAELILKHCSLNNCDIKSLPLLSLETADQQRKNMIKIIQHLSSSGIF